MKVFMIQYSLLPVVFAYWAGFKNSRTVISKNYIYLKGKDSSLEYDKLDKFVMRSILLEHSLASEKSRRNILETHFALLQNDQTDLIAQKQSLIEKVDLLENNVTQLFEHNIELAHRLESSITQEQMYKSRSLLLEDGMWKLLSENKSLKKQLLESAAERYSAPPQYVNNIVINKKSAVDSSIKNRKPNAVFNVLLLNFLESVTQIIAFFIVKSLNLLINILKLIELKRIRTTNAALSLIIWSKLVLIRMSRRKVRPPAPILNVENPYYYQSAVLHTNTASPKSSSNGGS